MTENGFYCTLTSVLLLLCNISDVALIRKFVQTVTVIATQLLQYVGLEPFSHLHVATGTQPAVY